METSSAFANSDSGVIFLALKIMKFGINNSEKIKKILSSINNKGKVKY